MTRVIINVCVYMRRYVHHRKISTNYGCDIVSKESKEGLYRTWHSLRRRSSSMWRLFVVAASRGAP